MAYQFGAIVGGGIAPLIATSLLAATGSTTPIALYVVGASLLMAACTIAWGRFRPPADDES
jgi:hypothetical protein